MPNSKLAVALLLFALAAGGGATVAGDETPRTALLLIDIQQFYFAEGANRLVDPGPAAANASRLLDAFRARGDLVVHVRHQASSDAGIRPEVAPAAGERVFTKAEVNAFKGTALLAYLREQRVTRLVIGGMMTHMCVEAAARAAHDLGFDVIVVGNACATRDLEYGGTRVPAGAVHASTLATLSRTYARVMGTDELLRFLAPHEDPPAAE